MSLGSVSSEGGKFSDRMGSRRNVKMDFHALRRSTKVLRMNWVERRA